MVTPEKSFVFKASVPLSG